MRQAGKKWKGVEGGGKLFAHEPGIASACPIWQNAEAMCGWRFLEIFDTVSSESAANFPLKKGSRIFKQRAPRRKLQYATFLCYSNIMDAKPTTRQRFTLEIDRENDGRWIAEIPKLPGVMAYGNTKQEAVRHARTIALRTLADSVEQGKTPAPVARLFDYGMARR